MAGNPEVQGLRDPISHPLYPSGIAAPHSKSPSLISEPQLCDLCPKGGITTMHTTNTVKKQ